VIQFRSVTLESGEQFVVCEDITDRRRAEETIRRLAYHDALTGLPNRRLFDDRLEVALAHARRQGWKLAVMLLDLDRFKDVNDTLGHTVGDELLQAVGARLTTLLRESDTVCRMGGDEFLLLLPGISEAKAAHKVAERILEAIREPFDLNGRGVRVTTSLGIAIYLDDGEDGDTLVENADVAMYHAKERGRDNYQWYSTSMRQVDTRPLGSTI
jgi:diguanylate cyclase (GGDEF)-like protein